MKDRRALPPSWRFPLFTRIVSGLASIIVVMILGGAIFLWAINDVFRRGEAEFHELQLSQYLQSLFTIESDAVSKYLDSKDSSQLRNFYRINRYFQASCDSMGRSISDDKGKHPLESVLLAHRNYTKFVLDVQVGASSRADSHFTTLIQRHSANRDTVITKLQLLTESFQATFLKELQSFFGQMHTAINGGEIILLLMFVVAFAMGIMLAQTITKPIKALKSGTEKVGEGKYETVAVTTNDEVADLTRAFNMMSDKLRQLDEMRMQMMSEISHEMRTPLQVIKAGCYSIVHTKDGPVLTQRQRDAVAMIHQATNRINSFVNSFLDIAKMEAGLMKFNFEQVDLVDLFSPLVQEAQLIAETRQIALEFFSEKFPTLMLDKERMSQLFSNLLSNALKYTPDSGKIVVQLSNISDCPGLGHNGKGCARIIVQDSGVGIPESDLARLFDKFYQAKNVPLVNEKGSGLGLALVKHVSEAHGGRVSVQSKVGEGSKFIVELPVR